MNYLAKKLGLAGVVFGGAALVATSIFAAGTYFNGFETDTAGWFNNGGTIIRVSSGTDGIPSATGSFHAKINGEGPYTQWGGYESTFPTSGYVTQVDVYVDMAENSALTTDKRFDFSSAINNPAGAHRRDFIFHLGTDPLVLGQWQASVSNNAPGWPSNPARSPVSITQTGWYTLKSTFTNNGSGILTVNMEVIRKSDSSVVGSWILSDPTDVIGVTVGGNRYGWFVTSDFTFLAIDNSHKFDIVPLVGPPTSKDQCKKDGWMTFNNPTFKNQGQCVSYFNHI